jgi:ABC-type sulfate transport system permease component
MDRGLWSLGSMIIGGLAAVIGIDWTFGLCGVVCAVAAMSLIALSRRQRAVAAT